MVRRDNEVVDHVVLTWKRDSISVSSVPPTNTISGAKMADLPAGVSELEVEVETMVEPQQEVQIETMPMIALQPLSEPEREEIVVQTTEEVIEESKPLVQEEPIPTTPPTKQRKGRSGKNKGLGRSGKGLTGSANSGSANVSNSDKGGGIGDTERTGTRKWEQKQVQIKTLEGEFGVRMWASGTFFISGLPPFTVVFNLLSSRL